ncbi:VWA domain-containing protein [Lentisalinibacter salinarum]|uniref:VWA domain-containing protein n=1 Tax=Lentisalinibacter salinarum TaxID=2992239 RepID=UPI003867C96F
MISAAGVQSKHRFAVTYRLLLLLLLGPAHVDAEIEIENIDSSRFPTIYINASASENGVAVLDLNAGNFSIEEDGRSQLLDSFTAPGIDDGTRRADIVFVVDVSGSMGAEIADVRNNIAAFASALESSSVDFALGLVRFGNSRGENPFIFNDGALTSDVATFQGFVDGLVASGSFEPSFLALRKAATDIVFRAGAQKVFILITDEDSDDREKLETVSVLLAADVTVHAAVNCSAGASNTDYCDGTSVRAATGGLLFGVEGPYAPILDSIAADAGGTYVLRYTTDNPAKDGIERRVDIGASIGGASATDFGFYVPGATPVIRLTEATRTLIATDWIEGTELAIEVAISDDVPPSASRAQLFFRAKGAAISGFESVAMSNSAGSLWEAAIPSRVVLSPGVEFYVTATDGESTSSLPSDISGELLQIAVTPNEAPIISGLEPVEPPEGYLRGAPVQINATVEDSTNSIASVSLFYRGRGDLAYKELARSFDSPTLSVNLGFTVPGEQTDIEVLEFYLAARDDLGITRFFPIEGGDAPRSIELEVPVEPGEKKQQIIFLPGILGSKLFEQGAGIIGDNTRWPSVDVDKDLPALQLDADGTAPDERRIFVDQSEDGVISETAPLIGTNIYKSFLSDVVNGANPDLKWTVFAYDWRLAFDDQMWRKLGDRSISRDFTILQLLRKKIDELVEIDKDGKVDIVAHSLGGLLTKRYVSEYPETKLGKLILVDSPQLGTPAGAWAVMHGAGQPIPGFFNIEDERRVFRKVSSYWPTAYILLPQRAFFENVVEEVFSDEIEEGETVRTFPYKETPLFDFEIAAAECAGLPSYDWSSEFREEDNFGTGVQTWDAWTRFFRNPGAVGTNSHDAVFSSIRPFIGEADANRVKLFEAGARGYDNSIGPSWSKGDVDQVYQFVGQNIQTPIGLSYELTGGACGLTYRVEERPFGDGTVVTESQAALDDATTFYIDLNAANFFLGFNRKHANVLEVPWIQEQIVRTLTGGGYVAGDFGRCTKFSVGPVVGCAEREQVTSLNEPISGDVPWTAFTFASPVEVLAYDSRGNRTGILPSGQVVQSIPNSAFNQVGDKKFLTLPDGYDDLTVEIKGLEVGEYSMYVDRYQHAKKIGSRAYLNIPITASYRGQIAFREFSDLGSIQQDVDGDGTIDSTKDAVGFIAANSRGAFYVSGGFRAATSMSLRSDPLRSETTGWLRFNSANSSGRVAVTADDFNFVQVSLSGGLKMESNCSVNGSAGYRCLVSLSDGGAPGANKDSFSIDIFGPDEFEYSSSGLLIAGDIAVTIR